MKKKIAPKKKLTRVEKKILICKDVLKHLKANKIKEKRRNTYLVVPQAITFFNKNNMDYENPEKISLQNILKETIKKCTVCALGAMLYSHVIRNNKYNVSPFDFTSNNTLECLPNAPYSSPLTKIFSVNELDNIEARFEYDKESVEEIMKDIIKNNGRVKICKMLWV